MILSKSEKEVLKSSFIYLKPHKLKLCMLYIISILSNVAELFPIYFTGNIINYVVEKDFSKIISCIIKILLVFVVMMVLSSIETYLSEYLKNSITRDIKNHIFNKVVTLPMSDYDALGIGHLMSVIEGDSSCIANFYTGQVLNIIIALITSVISFVFMLKLSVLLAIISVVTFPISFIGMKYFGKKIKVYVEKIRILNDEYTLSLTEILSYISEVKCLCQEDNMKKRFFRYQEKFFDLNMKTSMLTMLSNIFDISMTTFSDWLVIGVGCYQMIHNKLKIGSYVSFNGYVGKFIRGINAILGLLVSFQTLSVSLKRINEILQKDSEDIEMLSGNGNQISILGDIEVSGLKFKYEHSHKNVLEMVNVNIKPNTVNVMVGLNGSGKSTLFKLLEKLYTFKEGSIEIDGKNIDKFSCGEIRQAISYVQQRTYLFSDTIRYNLTFEADSVTEEEIYEVCKEVGIHDLIMSFPEQYNTLLGKGGIRLSGGETQKLAIARALLRKTKIILLDESTSDLDGSAEREILNILHKISEDHTIIMISHRISAIVGIENIYVFKNGVIVAHGNHTELLKENVDYQMLVQCQMSK